MIYLFPGLGADGRLFRDYDFAPHEISVVEYRAPWRRESLRDYCVRMAQQISPRTGNVYIGVSFGGILAQEISKLIPPQKIIIISSIKSTGEAPGAFRIFRSFPLHRIMPASWIKTLGVWISSVASKKSEREKQLFSDLMYAADDRLIKWGIDQLVNWKQDLPPAGVIQIHGDRDPIFPIRNLKPDYVIEGGLHFMVMREVKEIQSLIKTLLAEQAMLAK